VHLKSKHTSKPHTHSKKISSNENNVFTFRERLIVCVHACVCVSVFVKVIFKGHWVFGLLRSSFLVSQRVFSKLGKHYN